MIYIRLGEKGELIYECIGSDEFAQTRGLNVSTLLAVLPTAPTNVMIKSL